MLLKGFKLQNYCKPSAMQNENQKIFIFIAEVPRNLGG